MFSPCLPLLSCTLQLSACITPPPFIQLLLMDCQCHCTFIDVLLHHVTLSVWHQWEINRKFMLVLYVGFACCTTQTTFTSSMWHVDLVTLHPPSPCSAWPRLVTGFTPPAVRLDWVSLTSSEAAVLIGLHAACVFFLLARWGNICFVLLDSRFQSSLI